MAVVNIDSFRQTALSRLEKVKADIESGECIGLAMALVFDNDDTGNMWVARNRPVTLIGEIHCLMSDIEFYEVDLRKHRESI